MTKTKQIIAALVAATGGKMPFRELHGIIGGEDTKLLNICRYLQKRRQLSVGDDEDQTITLGKQRKSAKRKPASRLTPHASRTKRPYKKLIERVAARKPNGADIGTLALANYLGAGALLRQAIEDGVEDLSECHALRNAITNHERAEQILNAARPA